MRKRSSIEGLRFQGLYVVHFAHKRSACSLSYKSFPSCCCDPNIIFLKRKKREKRNLSKFWCHSCARGEENSLFLHHRFWLVELFWMIYSVNNVACLHLVAESSVSHCEEISNYFSNKITQIQADMLVPVLANSWLFIVLLRLWHSSVPMIRSFEAIFKKSFNAILSLNL